MIDQNDFDAEITARGAYSCFPDDKHAVDADVFWRETLIGECTLTKDKDTGLLDTFGELGHWASGSLIEELDACPAGDRHDVILAIVAAVREAAEMAERED